MSEHGICPRCGTPRVCTGAPIWDTFCPNKECTHDRDEFRQFFTDRREEHARQQRIRDAAPDLLDALKMAKQFLAFSAPDNVWSSVADAIAKAEGNS